MAVAVTIHVLFVVIWVGGMFFAHQCLRPVAASQLEPPLRLRLWVGVFGRFFPWVWIAIGGIFISGLWMIFAVLGGFKHLAAYVHQMFGLGVVMMSIFMHIYFAPYKRLKAAVTQENWSEGAKQLDKIRLFVGINTVIGLLTIAIAAGGRFLPS
jgi:uncharacterized membrane protein